MPISSLANLLFAPGLPNISPSVLPSLDFTFRPSVLAAGAAATLAGWVVVAAGACAFGPAVCAGPEAAGGGASVFWRDAQPKRKTRHAAETSSSLRGIVGSLCVKCELRRDDHTPKFS